MVGPNYRSSITLCRTLPVPKDPEEELDLVFKSKLISCDLDEEPDYKWQDSRSEYSITDGDRNVIDEIYVLTWSETDIRKVCTCISDLSGVDPKRFSIKTTGYGLKYYVVEFELTISLIDEVLQFELSFEGEKFGSATAKFDS